MEELRKKRLLIWVAVWAAAFFLSGLLPILGVVLPVFLLMLEPTILSALLISFSANGVRDEHGEINTLELTLCVVGVFSWLLSLALGVVIASVGGASAFVAGSTVTIGLGVSMILVGIFTLVFSLLGFYALSNEWHFSEIKEKIMRTTNPEELTVVNLDQRKDRGHQKVSSHTVTIKMGTSQKTFEAATNKKLIDGIDKNFNL